MLLSAIIILKAIMPPAASNTTRQITTLSVFRPTGFLQSYASDEHEHEESALVFSQHDALFSVSFMGFSPPLFRYFAD